MSKQPFPVNFLWGASTSSHQVEGGTNNQWSRWEKLNAHRLAATAVKKFAHWLPKWDHFKDQIQDPENYISGVADDHWNRYEEDLDLAKSLGMTAYRFSLEWSRIEPEEGKFDIEAIAHYQQMVDAMRTRGIEPFVTLWHFTNPLWFEDRGGWKRHDSSQLFARYATHATKHLKGIKYWMTLNEPNVYTSMTFLVAWWPPEQRNPVSAWKVRRHLQQAHRLAYEAVKTEQPELQVGLVENISFMEGVGFIGQLVAAIGRRLDQYHLPRARNHTDFFGLNHYFHSRIVGLRLKNEDKHQSDPGWELYPESLYEATKVVAKYGKPIYITEHGVADAHDQWREWYTRESLRGLQRAISEGADVRGYLHWSLLDNFEWAFGFWPRFGLIEVDRKTLKRTVRPSARKYAEIINENGISDQ